MKRLGVLLLLSATALACGGPRLDRTQGSCTHLQAVREVRGTALCADAWSCERPPGGRFDRLGLHRLAPCEDAVGPVVLYLPGMHMNGELRATDPRTDLRLTLALAGVRTWGLDYRTHAVPPTATPAELGALAAWTPEVFAEDVAWAAGFVRGIDAAPLHVAGFSQGGGFAYQLAARGEPLASLVILDGALPAGRSGGGTGPAIDVAGGRLPFPERQQLLAAVLADPSGPSPVAGYETAGGALAEILYSAPSFGGHGGLANARDGVSDVSALAALLLGYDRWWPRAAVHEAAPRPAQKLPVLAFASVNMGNAWVERVRSAANTFGGSQAVVRELPEYGHLDVLVARTASENVFEPVLAWLEGRPATP
jgi:pimeloyl-ACP methyl ester carboxylesterase